MAGPNDYNLGNDISVIVNGPFGRVDLGIVTGFKIKQIIEKVKVNPLNGKPMEKHVPMGWEGSLEIERANDAADRLASAIEAGFLSTGEVGSDGTMTMFITEKDKTTSVYLGEGLAISLSDAGNWERGKSVKQTLDFFLSSRRKVA